MSTRDLSDSEFARRMRVRRIAPSELEGTGVEVAAIDTSNSVVICQDDPIRLPSLWEHVKVIGDVRAGDFIQVSEGDRQLRKIASVTGDPVWQVRCVDYHAAFDLLKVARVFRRLPLAPQVDPNPTMVAEVDEIERQRILQQAIVCAGKQGLRVIVVVPQLSWIAPFKASLRAPEMAGPRSGRTVRFWYGGSRWSGSSEIQVGSPEHPKGSIQFITVQHARSYRGIGRPKIIVMEQVKRMYPHTIEWEKTGIFSRP